MTTQQLRVRVEALIRHRRTFCCCPFSACILSSDDVEAAEGETEALLIQNDDFMYVVKGGSV